MVPVLIIYAVLVVMPAAALLAAGHALQSWCHSYPRTSRHPGPTGSSIERLAGDLRRLSADYHRIAGSDLPARVSRLRTVTLAYDDRLRDCCCALGLPEPGDPLSAVDRLHTEAALAQQGVTW